jgi:hypothetical protein
VTYADLSFAQWNAQSDESAHRIAQELADRQYLRLAGLERRTFAGRSHRVALFDRHGMRFALVPGGRPTLGYEASAFRPTPDQAAGYAESADEYGLPKLAEFVDAMTSPVRSMELPAMLVAVDAFDPCEIPLSPDDPQVLELVAAIERGGIEAFESDGAFRIELGPDGRIARAWLTRDASYDAAVAGLDSIGLRTASPDEWEWACGAGAATLFRWGDDCPDDGYPYDHETGPHREPNLWGLAIGQDPYKHEATTDRTVVCGGDGGSATCGGTGFFIGWLGLATAFRDREFGQWLASDDGYADEILTRPVVDLS